MAAEEKKFTAIPVIRNVTSEEIRSTYEMIKSQIAELLGVEFKKGKDNSEQSSTGESSKKGKNTDDRRNKKNKPPKNSDESTAISL